MIKNNFNSIVEHWSEAYDKFVWNLFKKLVPPLSIFFVFMIIEIYRTVFKSKGFYNNIFLFCESFFVVIFVFLSVKFAVWMKTDIED